MSGIAMEEEVMVMNIGMKGKQAEHCEREDGELREEELALQVETISECRIVNVLCQRLAC